MLSMQLLLMMVMLQRVFVQDPIMHLRMIQQILHPFRFLYPPTIIFFVLLSVLVLVVMLVFNMLLLMMVQLGVTALTFLLLQQRDRVAYQLERRDRRRMSIWVLHGGVVAG